MLNTGLRVGTRRISAMLLLHCTLLFPFASGHAGADETGRTEPAGPNPVFKVVRESGEDMVVDALGKVPLGKVPVAIYKVADFGRELGVAATEREDKSLGANIILVNADAALFKGMVARGLDTNSDPKAIKAKKRLTLLIEEMDSGDQNRWVHLGAVTMKHLPYAVAQVGADKGMKAAFGKLVKWGGPKIDKALPIGDEVHDILGNRSALASGLRYVGWRKLGARANLAKKYTDELMHKVIQASLDELVSAGLKRVFGEAVDDLYKEVMEGHPSELRQIVIRKPELYATIEALPAMAMPAPQAAQAAPVPLPAVAAAAPEPVELARDRVANYIYVDDRNMRSRSTGSERSPSQSSPPPPPPPEQPHQQPAWLSHYHEALKCAGAGSKAGCGSWDGARGQTINGR